MSSPPANQSSGSEGDLKIDERKRKRMLSNRESARRSRMRKQQHLDDLINEGAKLREENTRIATQADLLAGQYNTLESENNILRAQVMEMTQKLQSLNSMLHILEVFSGVDMDIPEIPDPLMKPWQCPCPVQPITAAADMFQF